ncbi:MAG: hypothetical protein A2Z93_01665 [Curvibacter sp. GWA2_64_110]|nr:MAG: hypothetical protein A2Z93_01665 [Curvibacter sp. GWA2_64_110]
MIRFWLIVRGTTSSMVVAVTTVHEDMHDGTSQQQQEGQRSDDMRQMLCHQEIAGNRPDDE